MDILFSSIFNLVPPLPNNRCLKPGLFWGTCVYAINLRNNLSRHNSHRMWTKRYKATMPKSEGLIVFLLWNAKKHNWNGYQEPAVWKYMKGSQHLNKFISDKKKKKRARRVPIFPGLFGMCQKVTRTSQNMQMLSSYIPFNHIVLWSCVQFIEIKKFMLRQCI